MDRYARKDAAGEPVESHPSETWRRVADAIGDTEEERREFNRVLTDFHFVPGGRILAGAGTGAEVTFYNCYVIPLRNETKPERGNDSREAIFDTRARMVDIMSRGGGVGINWSTLRPKGAYLSRINGTTSGPLAWMHAASEDVGTVEQGGSRRGAAMFMLNDWHPDIMDFVNCKRDLKKVTNANISVGISDKFMEAVKADGDWILRFPDTAHPKYDSDWDGDIDSWDKRSLPTKEYQTIKAHALWDALAAGAHDNGEPGVVFLERYNAMSTGADVEKIICVNPCGEQGLGPYSVCNLGSINLPMYLKDFSWANEQVKFDWDAFRKDVRVAIRFLDNVVDKNFYGDMKESEEVQRNIRRVGLSIQGLADVLIYQRLKYGSHDAIEFTEAVYKEMKLAAMDASADLAKEKGAAAAWTERTLRMPYFQGIPAALFAKIQKQGMRNMFLLTQAPIGSTSILAGSNSGIEPFFAWKEKRIDRTNPDDGWIVDKQIVADYLAVNPVTVNSGGRLKLPDYFITANEVSVEGHVDMMAAAQKYIDSSISKTINAPNSHTVADVSYAYMRAYDKGLKALAYFRDGSGRQQVLERLDIPAEMPVAASVIATEAQQAYRRDQALFGVTRRYPTVLGTAFVTVNKDYDGAIRELFVNVGKAGSDVQHLSESIARIVSTSLQHGVAAHAIRAQLEGVGGYGKMRKTLPAAIAEAIAAAENDGDRDYELVLAGDDDDYDALLDSDESEGDPVYVGKFCPTCQEFSVVRTNGCEECVNACGYTAC